MKDEACVRFLQQVLPRLRLRWPGLRKVRGQVCKRIGRRIKELGLEGLEEYRRYLGQQEREWEVLAGLCRVTISRFYRDRGVFDFLGEVVLPALAQSAAGRGDGIIRCWSAGCASGEEAYSLAMLWRFGAARRYPEARLDILGTDLDAHLLNRARRGRYPAGSLRDLPAAWRQEAFIRENDHVVLRRQYRKNVCFARQDIRQAAPAGPFHLVLCRNLVFTYFIEALQQEVLRRIVSILPAGGVLVLGIHESLPACPEAVPWEPCLRIFRKKEQ